MWLKSQKKKKKKKKEEEEKEERAERLCRSLTAKIQELEFKLLSLNKDIGSSLSLTQKIQQTRSQIDPHEKENKKIRSSLFSTKKEIEDVEKILKPYLDHKKKIFNEKMNKIEKLQKKIKNFKSNSEIENIVETLNKKNEKLKKYTSETNTLKNLRTKSRREYQTINEEDKDGSWKTKIPKGVLIKILSDTKELNKLNEEMSLLDKRKKKLIYQNKLKSNTSIGFITIEQRLQEAMEKIQIGQRENLKIKREILEMKELLGDETLYSTIDGNSEDMLSTDSEFTSVSSSNELPKSSNKRTDLSFSNTASHSSSKTSQLRKVNRRSISQILLPKENDPIKKNGMLTKVKDSQSIPHVFKKGNNEEFSKYINKRRNKKNKKKKKKFTIDSLQTLFKIPIAVEYFRDFLVSQLCQENIMFWLAVKSLKQKDSTENQINKSSKKIFQTYILYESPFEINIQSNLRETLIKQYNNKNFFMSMFDEAHDAVLEHMIFNSWGPFQETRHFTNLLKKLKKDPNYENLSNSTQKMKLRYNIQPYKGLNEGNEYHDKIFHPITVVERLLEQLIQLLDIHYRISKNVINFKNIYSTIPFQKFVKKTAQLKYIKLDRLKSENEKLCFFLNVYNLLTVHGFLSNGLPHDQSSMNHHRRDSIYLIGGNYYSLNDIFHGILRANTFIKSNSNKITPYFKTNDERIKYSLFKIEPMIHFAIIDPYRISQLNIYRLNGLLQSLEKTTTDLLLPLVMIKKSEKMKLPKSLLTYERDFNNHGGLLNWMSKFVSMNLMSQILANQQIKYSTKIFKNPQLLVDFEQYSIKQLHFNL
ncbi:electron carrier/ protein disulfide oxidoreductase [Anaeramoeba flamelloides]|uniref:Electron carrier/ protein disulfide oxidoreductase n=1 Tax=Anaeramoeba flamelloides TaxID=1746091 RepID=A0ABQ8Z2E6_9EUKA|nr:electron carrier/ protein disulfide oxidoreductase [Anaeramoeba flamelloides]